MGKKTSGLSRTQRAAGESSCPPEAGYCLLPAVVTAQTVARLRATIDQLIARGGQDAGVELRSGTQWIRGLGDTVPGLEAHIDEPRVRSVLEELIGGAPRLESVRMRNPVGASAQQSLHVDAAGPVTPGADELAQVLLFLDDVDENNGPPRLVPGSHRSGAVPGREYADPVRRHPGEIAVTCRAGDALVFSSHLWHRGTASFSGRPRRALTFAFRRSQSGGPD